MSELVRVRELSLRYPYAERPALREVSFSLAQGERVLLLGPSGGGKSSLALCLNGLIPHSVEAEVGGSVCVLGRDTRHVGPADLARHVGIVFQDPESQFCTLTVQDEIAFGLENLKLPHAEMDARIDRALEQVGMEGHRRTRLDRLSGGMKQRIAIAAALAMRPALLILDEATSNLDPAGTVDLYRLVRQLVSENPDLTFLLIEHQLDALIDLIDRVLVLDKEGCLRFDLPPRELFDKHGDTWQELGIWQPTATVLARHLKRKNFNLPDFPLTVPQVIHDLRRLPAARDAATVWARNGAGAGPGPETEFAVQLRDVSFHYPNGFTALQNTNLAVRRGEILALLGGNGAGKTTLAQIMVGLLRPQRGVVRILGEEVTNANVRDLVHRCGFVFQNPEHQFVTDRVLDELTFGFEGNGTAIPRAHELLKRFGLTEKSEANPFELSQGEKRRLSVATMLVSDKPLLVLDEPTFGQDAKNSRELSAHMRQLNRAGTTLVLLTHDMELVWELAHRAAVMMDGKVVKVAPVQEIFADAALLQQAKLEPPPRARIAAAVQEMKNDTLTLFQL